MTLTSGPFSIQILFETPIDLAFPIVHFIDLHKVPLDLKMTLQVV